MKDSASSLEVLFEQLTKELASRGENLTKGLKVKSPATLGAAQRSLTQCVVKFDVDGETWTLELLDDAQRLTKGDSDLEADVELRASEENLIKIIMGQLTPQTVTDDRRRGEGDAFVTRVCLSPGVHAREAKAARRCVDGAETDTNTRGGSTKGETLATPREHADRQTV